MSFEIVLNFVSAHSRTWNFCFTRVIKRSFVYPLNSIDFCHMYYYFAYQYSTYSSHSKIFFIYCDITLHWSKRDMECESGNVCYSDYKTICITSATRI